MLSPLETIVGIDVDTQRWQEGQVCPSNHKQLGPPAIKSTARRHINVEYAAAVLARDARGTRNEDLSSFPSSWLAATLSTQNSRTSTNSFGRADSTHLSTQCNQRLAVLWRRQTPPALRD